jgi:hypothetical protein
VLADVGLRIMPELTKSPSEPDDVVAALGKRLGGLPEAVRSRVAAHDLQRIERPLALLEHFWATISNDLSSNPSGDLVRLAESGFFAITTDEAALSRYALELRLLELMGLGVDTKPLEARIRALEESSASLVRQLARARSEADWRKLLRSSKSA